MTARSAAAAQLELLAPDPPAPPPPREAPARACPRCGWLVELSAATCPLCQPGGGAPA